MKQLEPLTDDQLEKGMIVIYIEPPGTVRVERIYSEVKKYAPQEAFLTGLWAEFDLLYADEHDHAEQCIWDQYFYRNLTTPTRSGVFKWPGMMPLHFKLAESSLSTRPGWLVHIEVRRHFTTFIIE
jgi:hypothetical protein